jgi:hypothetical protein
MLTLDMHLGDANVSLEFNWYTDEPDWDSMSVYALLPKASLKASETPEGKAWVKVNDILSDDQWNTIERTIYENEDELRRQAIEQEY